jgi:hypothetical protein
LNFFHILIIFFLITKNKNGIVHSDIDYIHKEIIVKKKKIYLEIINQKFNKLVNNLFKIF